MYSDASNFARKSYGGNTQHKYKTRGNSQFDHNTRMTFGGNITQPERATEMGSRSSSKLTKLNNNQLMANSTRNIRSDSRLLHQKPTTITKVLSHTEEKVEGVAM